MAKCLQCDTNVPSLGMFEDVEGRWYERYRCGWCNRRWQLRVEWTETQRAEWYRDNVLTTAGLKSAPTATPWDDAR